MSSNNIRSPLKWIGGKHESAERIVQAFPSPDSYDTYVEPCGGAAWVLLSKPPYKHREVFNDLDDNLVTFWQEMQLHADVMQERLKAFPYSRKLYYEYYRSLFDGTQLESTERAIRWFYALRLTGTGWLRKSPVGWSNIDSNVHSYRSALELFKAVQERFKYVLLDNRDVLATIKRYDSPRTFFYIDPPYFGAEQYYEVSKKGFPHEGLAKALQQIQGCAALSYYPHVSVDAWYKEWRRMSWDLPKHSQIHVAERLDIATEMLLMNYPEQLGLWSA